MSLRKRTARAPEGAPAWLLTYGDMATLLLTFFVMLASMSEVKKDQRLLDFMQAVNEAFGSAGGERYLPTEEVQVPKNVEETRVLVMAIYPQDFGYSDDEGAVGKRHLVQNIRPGERYQPGGAFHLRELSAELSPAEIAAVAEHAVQLRGYTTLIEVRGHCSKRPVEGSGFRDHMELSLARARAVADILIENGIDPQRIHIIGAGTTQPIIRGAYDAVERQRNDVVELLQIDQTIDELELEEVQPAP